jgi:uncharacterized surface protein with fasciclin (FAS1) repeats
MDMKTRFLGAIAAGAIAIAGAAYAASNPMVGGAAMYDSKTIVENAMNSQDHTTLVAAVKAAGLVETLQGDGPFTVFAPTNAAFSALPAGTVENLVKPENKGTLTSVLTDHVVPGKWDSQALSTAIAGSANKLTLKTVQGETLLLSGKGQSLTITDSKGNQAISPSPTSIRRTA